MIRLVYAIRRDATLTQQAFVDAALGDYGSFVKDNAEPLGVIKHQQLHNLTDPTEPTVDALRGTMLRPFDAVFEFWFESMDSVARFKGEAEQMLFELELDLIDHGESSAWLAYEVPHINPTPEDLVAALDSPVARLFYSLRPPQGMTAEEAQWYWRVQHGPLVRSVGQDIQTLRYIQVHALESEAFQSTFCQKRGLGEPFYGHAELWFDLERPPSDRTKAAGVMLYEDETRFIDFSQSAIFYGKETVLFES
jgi:hypothetical protein